MSIASDQQKARGHHVCARLLALAEVAPDEETEAARQEKTRT